MAKVPRKAPGTDKPQKGEQQKPAPDDTGRVRIIERGRVEPGGVGPWWGRTMYIAIGLLIGVALLAVAWLLSGALALFFLGLVIAEALAPVVEWLDRYMNRVLAVLLVYLVLILLFAALLYAIIPTFVAQARAIIAQVPGFLQKVETFLDRIPGINTASIIGLLTTAATQFGATLVSLPVAIIISIVDAVFVFFVSLYWLITLNQARRFFCSLFSDDIQKQVATVLHNMGSQMGGFIRAAVINGIFIAGFSYLGLTLIGIDFALVLALFAGLMEFLPVIGPVLAAIPMIIAALSQSFTKALIVLGFVIALQEFEGHILVPNVMRSMTQIAPVLALLAVYAGAELGGLLGAIVAVPLAAAARVFTLEVIAPAIRRWTGARRV